MSTNDVDDLIEEFQRACEEVAVSYERGATGDLMRFTKERAALRNELRARLLARVLAAANSSKSSNSSPDSPA